MRKPSADILQRVVDESARVEARAAARRRALEAVEGALFGGPGDIRRWFAVGDPQTTFDVFSATLAHHGLLGADGLLRPHVGLVSMGDHFDFDAPKTDDPVDREREGLEGRLILGWLAAHAPAQVRILLGNHDAARVMELAALDDDAFRTLRAEAYGVARDSDAVWGAAHGLPSAGLLSRDFSTWSAAQRTQVQRLLLEGRYDLALAAETDDGTLLMTHAGLTMREWALLHRDAAQDVPTIAAGLQPFLAAAVERVRAAWVVGRNAPLSLEPLHVSSQPGREAGGLLSHRPANVNRDAIADAAWEWDPSCPRRFAPADLPTTFDQAVGHTGRRKLLKEPSPWSDGVASRAGDLHTLTFGEGTPRLVQGTAAPEEGRRRLFLVDPSLSQLGAGERAGLMPLRRVCPRPTSAAAGSPAR
ncbi:MAG: hypothetical protein RL199_1981 [Pseudomonadota bacterium]|jgi:hypothetical protein